MKNIGSLVMAIACLMILGSCQGVAPEHTDQTGGRDRKASDSALKTETDSPSSREPSDSRTVRNPCNVAELSEDGVEVEYLRDIGCASDDDSQRDPDDDSQRDPDDDSQRDPDDDSQSDPDDPDADQDDRDSDSDDQGSEAPAPTVEEIRLEWKKVCEELSPVMCTQNYDPSSCKLGDMTAGGNNKCFARAALVKKICISESFDLPKSEISCMSTGILK